MWCVETSARSRRAARGEEKKRRDRRDEDAKFPRLDEVNAEGKWRSGLFMAVDILWDAELC